MSSIVASLRLRPMRTKNTAALTRARSGARLRTPTAAAPATPHSRSAVSATAAGAQAQQQEVVPQQPLSPSDADTRFII